jgi:hypothetical protein
VSKSTCSLRASLTKKTKFSPQTWRSKSTCSYIYCLLELNMSTCSLRASYSSTCACSASSASGARPNACLSHAARSFHFPIKPNMTECVRVRWGRPRATSHLSTPQQTERTHFCQLQRILVVHIDLRRARQWHGVMTDEEGEEEGRDAAGRAGEGPSMVGM